MNEPLAHFSETAKHWIDALSVGAIVATLFDYLPGLTAALVCVWTIMRLYECWLNIRIKRRELGE